MIQILLGIQREIAFLLEPVNKNARYPNFDDI